MFDIGFWELVLIGIVGLVVIGPERLPGVARTVGKYVGRMRRFISSVKDDIDRELRQDELRQALKRDADLDEVKNIINDTRFTIEDEVQQSQAHVVKARDDDPRGDFSQNDLLEQQEREFENEDYGLTDHTDYGAEEEPAQPGASTQVKDQAANTKKQDGGQNEKSNG
jgi:sec-independent protein translocase protein TatB